MHRNWVSRVIFKKYVVYGFPIQNYNDNIHLQYNNRVPSCRVAIWGIRMLIEREHVSISLIAQEEL